jgi:flagellar hook protein FlgE
MASTTALYTGLSGMQVNARRLEVIGNNIANANTTAFKSSRMLFADQFYRTYSTGSPPGTASGGANPVQVGLGVGIAGTQRDFNAGSISASGDPRDLAIDGRGFFVVDRNGSQMYTRAGSFRQNALNDLVTIDGDRVRGFAVDQDFNILPGQLVDLNIPLGTMKLAEATRNVNFAGNLNSSGDAATRGSLIQLGGTTTDGLGLSSGATVPPAPGDVLETSSLMSEIAAPGSTTTPLFAVGQIIEIKDAEKGNRTIPAAQFTVTPTSTVQDFMDFLTTTLVIDTTTGPNPNGDMPGISLDPTTGFLSIVGNTGSVNDIALDPADIRILDSSETFISAPLATVKQGDADGEAVRTTFVVYDSLGTPVSLDVSMVLDSKSNIGTTWRYYVESPDAPSGAMLGTGTISFDTDGQIQGNSTIAVSIDRSGTGAVSPLGVTLNLSSETDNITALTSEQSVIAATFQDGAPLGVLASFGVGADGTITGSFTNGLTRTMGQVAMASFANQEGMVDAGNNLWTVGPNSGTPVITTPGSFGTGKVIGGALELSNVDLGQEFINMILTSTGYSASSRVIRTTDELMQQLLVIGR